MNNFYFNLNVEEIKNEENNENPQVYQKFVKTVQYTDENGNIIERKEEEIIKDNYNQEEGNMGDNEEN